jgi:hypothetical protein
MGPLIAPLITAGASILGNLFNKSSVEKTNQRQEDFNTQMYNRQRADALTDWDKQNAYNSPSQQMQRFKEAGLNPNLIYGQMSNAPAVRSTDMKAPDFVAPRYDTSKLGDVISEYYNTEQQKMNLKQQDIALQIAQEQKKGLELDNRKKETILPYQSSSWELNNQKLQAQINDIMQSALGREGQRSLLPYQKDKIQAEIKNIGNTIDISKQTFDMKKKFNDIMKSSIRQAMQINLNKNTLDNKNYELRKLAEENANKLRTSQIRVNENKNVDHTDYSGQFLDLFKLVLPYSLAKPTNYKK